MINNNKYFKKAWFASSLKGIRETEEYHTYDAFNYDELPEIPKNLNNDFSWLKPVLKGKKLRYPELEQFETLRSQNLGKGVDLSEELQVLENQLLQYGIALPVEIKTFLCTPAINGRIRSATDNYFELGKFIEVVYGDQPYFLLHFMSDSQYCLLWYVCFDKNGNHYIITSSKLYGHTNSVVHNLEFKDDPLIGYYCADSFKDFIYRYDIEQRIGFKKSWYIAALDKEEEKYVNHYLNLN